jgi:hypothetical protein
MQIHSAQNAELLTVRAGGTHGYNCDLRGETKTSVLSFSCVYPR